MNLLAKAWRDLGRDGLNYLLGEGASKGLIYLLLVVLAPLVGVAGFGSVNLFIALVGPLGLVIGLGLPDAVGRFYFRPEPFDRTLASALALLAVTALTGGLLLLAARGQIEELFGVPPLLTSLAALCAPAIAVRSVGLAVLRAAGRSAAVALARLAEPLASLAIVLVLLTLSGTLALRDVLLAYVGGIVAVALPSLGGLLRRARGRPSRPLSAQLLGFSLPLILHALAMTGLASFDQIILNQILGLEATGIYAFAYRIAMAMFLVSFAAASAWSPFVLRRLAAPQGPGDLRKLLRVVAVGEALVGVALMVLLPPLARWVGTAEYAAATALIPIVVCSYVWGALYALATPFLVFRHRTASLALSSATALAVNIGLNYLLIPHFGPLAAALTTLLSYALLFALVWKRALRDFPGLPWAELTAIGLLTLPPAAGIWWLLS